MMDGTLVSLLATLATATGLEQILRSMTAAAQRTSSCDHVLFAMQVQRRYLAPVRVVASGYPPEYARLYEENGFATIDPTIAHCQRTTAPVLWSPALYTRENVELLEASRAYGLSEGVSLSYHEGSEAKSMISFSRDRPFSQRELPAVVDLARVTIACAHFAAKQTVVPELVGRLRSKLSRREAECLKYICDGKSNWVIAQQLKISESTVEFHVANTYRKLGVSSRYQAMAAGIALQAMTDKGGAETA